MPFSLPFSLPPVSRDKIIFLGFMVAIFLAVGVANHFYQERPEAPKLIIVDVVNLAGRGNLPPLNDVMGKDSELSRMVNELSSVPAPQLFTKQNIVDAMIVQILFRWAGADMAQKEANGPYIDARIVAFLKRIGSFPVTSGPVTSGDGQTIDIKQAADLDQLWFKIFDHYRAPLLAQTAGKDIFGGRVSYDVNTDTLKIKGDLSPEFIGAFETELQSSNNSGEIMRSLLDFVDSTKGFANLSEKDQDLIMGIHASKKKVVIHDTPAAAEHPH